VSWRSIQRIGQNPGRGSGSSRRAQQTPVKVTAAAASQMITPTTRTHGVVAMMPAMATPNPRYPSRSAQTAILQCRLVRSPASSSTPNGLLGVVYGNVLPAADPDGDVVTRRTLCIISRPARGLGAASDESNDAQAR